MTTDARPFALILQNDGGFVLADWTLTTTSHALLVREGLHKPGWMRPHRVDPMLTVWSDSDAPWRDVPANHSAHRLLDIPYVFCGPVVLTGPIPDGYAVEADGLTQDQALRLIERHLSGKRVLMRSLHAPAQRTR
ncbi:hypothetical protein [Streptomyces sp. NPDC059072]|uniref:hypothetical protein n=1 Tax=Streptomyces sp. NPDC059072 TaxID=3346715 RepID=UPI0036A9C27C